MKIQCLAAKREFDNPMDKHAMEVALGSLTVGHLLVSSPE